MSCSLADYREDFERLVAKVISRGRKEFLGKGPTKVSVSIRKKYLIVEMSGFYTQLQETLIAQGEWSSVRKIEDIISQNMVELLITWCQSIVDIRIPAHATAMIEETKTKILFLVADRAWEEAQLIRPISEIDLGQVMHWVKSFLEN